VTVNRSSMCLLALFFLGCSEEGAPDTRRELLETWSTELIVAGYAEFDTRSAEVSTSLGALCALPSTETLEAARADWTAARETWKEADVFAFGPYSRAEFRIGPKIDSWPARVEDIEALLASDTPVDPASVAEMGVWEKGLPVIEYLLYPPGPSGLESLSTPRRCEYLTSLGTERSNRAREIHEAWAPEGGNFAGQLSGAGRTSTAFRSLRDAFGEVVNRMGFLLENVRKDKLGRPLGDEAGGLPLPDNAESRFSGRSLADINDNLDGLERLYFGDSSRGLPGLSRYAVERGQSFDGQVRSSIDASRAALDVIGMPLTAAVETAPDRVREASARLGELQTLFQVDIISALGLTLSFNDNDGD
jgi:predicted lipoprotein